MFLVSSKHLQMLKKVSGKATKDPLARKGNASLQRWSSCFQLGASRLALPGPPCFLLPFAGSLLQDAEILLQASSFRLKPYSPWKVFSYLCGPTPNLLSMFPWTPCCTLPKWLSATIALVFLLEASPAPAQGRRAVDHGSILTSGCLACLANGEVSEIFFSFYKN